MMRSFVYMRMHNAMVDRARQTIRTAVPVDLIFGAGPSSRAWISLCVGGDDMTAKSVQFEGWTRYRKATNAQHEWIKQAQDDMETLKNWKLSWCNLLSFFAMHGECQQSTSGAALRYLLNQKKRAAVRSP